MIRKFCAVLIFTLLIAGSPNQAQSCARAIGLVSEGYRPIENDSIPVKQKFKCNKPASINDRFIAERKKNRQNLKKAAKFYNPVTVFFRLFGI